MNMIKRVIRQFRRGMAFNGKRHIVGRHAAAIINNGDFVNTAAPKGDANLLRPRIKRIFDKFF